MSDLVKRLREHTLHYSEQEAAADRIEALENELAECRKDAERYRWLRADNAYFPEEEMVVGGDELDAAIDAAIGESK